MVKLLKEFDKQYVTHMKGVSLEMAAIHSQAMQPLSNLLESNLNYYNICQLQKKGGLPDFRFEACEEKFAQHMTRICELFRDFGKPALTDPFDIR